MTWPEKYATQLRLFCERMNCPSIKMEIELFRQAFILAIEIPKRILIQNHGIIALYSTENIDEAFISNWLKMSFPPYPMSLVRIKLPLQEILKLVLVFS